MLMNDSEPAEIEALLAKRKNLRLREYVDALRRKTRGISEKAARASGDLSMNNRILEDNYETLVRVLVKIDKALSSIQESLDTHEKAVDSVSAASEELVRSSE